MLAQYRKLIEFRVLVEYVSNVGWVRTYVRTYGMLVEYRTYVRTYRMLVESWKLVGYVSGVGPVSEVD